MSDLKVEVIPKVKLLIETLTQSDKIKIQEEKLKKEAKKKEKDAAK